ncbi:MAG: 5-(carboxyamino)imidazole ribonucleotide synthase [Crocinitomicaceae bacterium]|nr:5-(carboxyamino)imidazole ribonucleotide synthase [Crocinitomicaceae bacterium]
MGNGSKNTSSFGPSLRLGVLGGGQLGRMMIQSAIDFDARVEVMDPSADAPCSNFTHRFVKGDLNDANDVVAFGRDLDCITIEIEHVSVEGLRTLEQQGVRVIPKPDHLAIIQDKGLQKEFYTAHQIPTARYQLINDVSEVGAMGFPIVQKMRKGGYDGKGVVLLKDKAQIEKAFTVPSVLEAAVDIEKELSVIVARNSAGEMKCFPVVESVFDPVANLVDYLIAPAAITAEESAEAERLAKCVVEAMNFEGLLAVELFLDTEGRILVNEVAPRTHNSGHHTIEANVTSQFEQHIRTVLDLPLGCTAPVHAVGAMINIVGTAEAIGIPDYKGIDVALATEGVHPHLYGKSHVKPFRKMGHVTITGDSREEVLERMLRIREQLAVEGKQGPSA